MRPPETKAPHTADIPAEIRRGAEEILVESELSDRLRSGKRLRVKAGFDPTAPDLHLGHTVLLNKMREFQQLGHEAIFLIGDFTALIGDPSGQDAARPLLSAERIRENAHTYKQQIFKILDPESTRVECNSRWNLALGVESLLRLASKYTYRLALVRKGRCSS